MTRLGRSLSLKRKRGVNSARRAMCSTAPPRGCGWPSTSMRAALPDRDAGQVALGDEHVGVGMARVGDHQHRAAGRDHLARLDDDVEHHAGRRRAQVVEVDPLGRQALGRRRGSGPRLGAGHLLTASALAQGAQLLAGGAALGHGRSIAPCQLIDSRPGGRALGQQALLAVEVGLGELLAGAGRLERGRHRADLLLAGARLDQLGLRPSGGRLVGSRVAGRTLQPVVELGQQLIGRDRVPFGDRDRLDPAADLEAERPLLEFDDSLIGAGMRLARPAATETRRRYRHHGRPDIYQTIDKYL